MSAPDTNVEKQKRRHGPVLVGIVAAVGLVIVAAFGIAVWIDEDRDLQDAQPVTTPTPETAPADG